MVTPKKAQPPGGRRTSRKEKAGRRGHESGTDANVQGEGDYASAREFNRDERGFVESHDTEGLARRAAPKDAAEAAELEKAERKGKAPARPDPDADDAGGEREVAPDDSTDEDRR